MRRARRLRELAAQFAQLDPDGGLAADEHDEQRDGRLHHGCKPGETGDIAGDLFAGRFSLLRRGTRVQAARCARRQAAMPCLSSSLEDIG